MKSKTFLCFVLALFLVGAAPALAAEKKAKGKAKAKVTKKADKKKKGDAKSDEPGGDGLSFGEPEKEDEASVLGAVDGQGLGACYVKLKTENLCIENTTERKCLEMAREKSPAICYFNEGELECTPQKTPGLGAACQGLCGKDSGEVNSFTFKIVGRGCEEDPEMKDNIYCQINEMRPASPNEDLGLCGATKTLGMAYDGICRRELPDKKAVICGKGRP